MDFKEFCDFLESVHTCKIAPERISLVKTFMENIRHQNYEPFPILRLLLPKIDRERPSHRIKESRISQLVIKMLQLPANNSSDRNLLSRPALSASLDFGEILYSVLRKYLTNQQTSLSVAQINDNLDAIANRTSDVGLDDILLKIFRSLTARDTKWLIKIIIKDLRLGLGDNALLNCYHKDGAYCYATNNDLRRVATMLYDVNVNIHRLQIDVFEAFRPMLSKRCESGNFHRCFPDGRKFLIETKFDGERFQIHYNKGEFRFFSRNAFDFTPSFGRSFTDGAYTRTLEGVFAGDAQKFILDGEMMLWNKRDKCYGSKGMRMDVKNLGKATVSYQPSFCAYDILLYNDKVLADLPLEKRLEYLNKLIIKPQDGVIVISNVEESLNRQNIVDALNDSVDHFEEGIIVKDPNSLYKCGERNTSGWFKVKMEYFDEGVVHDLDLVVMGGSFGPGRKINTFVVGAFEGEEEGGGFLSMGSISSGLNGTELKDLDERLQKDGCEFGSLTKNNSKKLKFGRHKPDICFDPTSTHTAITFTIRATELTRNPQDKPSDFSAPYSLRFPRVLQIRYDKPSRDCLSLHELRTLCAAQGNASIVKLNKRHLELNELNESVRRRKKAKTLEIVTVLDKRTRTIKSEVLKGRKIHIAAGTVKHDELYAKIKRSGGETAYRIDTDVDIVLTDATSLEELGDPPKPHARWDIIHVGWLNRVLNAQNIVPYEWDEIISLGEKYNSDLSDGFDRYGDSYAQLSNHDQLRRVLKMMEGRKLGFRDFNKRIRGAFNKFCDFNAYFDRFITINNSESEVIYDSNLDELKLLLHHGTVSEELTKSVNLIVVKDGVRKKFVSEYLEQQNKQIQVEIKDFLHE